MGKENLRERNKDKKWKGGREGNGDKAGGK